MLAWLRDYLNERYQCTAANNIISEQKFITCGVPQGSVCGPLIFLLYNNNIACIVKKCNLSLYADNTVLYVPNENIDDEVIDIQDLNNLSSWRNENKLTINSKKTKYSIYGS